MVTVGPMVTWSDVGAAGVLCWYNRNRYGVRRLEYSFYEGAYFLVFFFTSVLASNTYFVSIITQVG